MPRRSATGGAGRRSNSRPAPGLDLDDWQKLALDLGLRRKGKKWCSTEVGVVVPRQNGKGGILEARELAGLFLFNERLITHSAHLIDTSLEAFYRIKALIEDTPELDSQVAHVSQTNGREGIKLRNGNRLRFRTRTKGGGRGFSGDCLILDEAMFLSEISYGALLPTLSARRDPQVWYTGSAVDQLVHDHGLVFARVRDRGLKGRPGLVYLEWAADGELDDLEAILDDPRAWQDANPALGIRITEEHIQMEREALEPRTFAVERLGVGDWPSVDGVAALIPVEKWLALADKDSVLLDPVALAFDVTPSRDSATIAAAGKTPDDLLHVEITDRRHGTGWLPARVAELVTRHQVVSVTCDPASPAAALVRPLENLGITVETTNTREYASACGHLFDLVEQEGLRHLGTDELTAAVKNAASRPLGEAWAWSRRLSAIDISPLVAATLAVWQASENLGSVYDDRGLLAV